MKVTLINYDRPSDGALVCGSSTFVVTMNPSVPQATTSLVGVSARALEILPSLKKHRCESGKHRSFATEIDDTEIAHLYEHILVELLVPNGSPRDSTRGETGWNFLVDGEGVYRVRVYSTLEPQGVSRAATQASAIMEWILSGEGTKPTIVYNKLPKV